MSCDLTTGPILRNLERTPSYSQRICRSILNLWLFFFPDIASRARFLALYQSTWRRLAPSEILDREATSGCPKCETPHLPCQRPDDATCASHQTSERLHPDVEAGEVPCPIPLLALGMLAAHPRHPTSCP